MLFKVQKLSHEHEEWPIKSHWGRENNKAPVVIGGKFRRRRLTKVERSILMAEYEKDSKWTREKI